MSLSVTLNITSCNTNTTTQATLTIAGAVRDQYADDFGYIYSENNDVKLSLDGTNFADEIIPTDNGTYTLYIQVGDIASTSSPTIFYEFYDGTDWIENSFILNFVSDEPVVDIPPESISFSLAPRASTIQFSVTRVNDSSTAVKNTITGTLLDYQYSYEVERISEQGARKMITGASLATKLAHSLINYRVEYHWHQLRLTRPTIQDHINALSSAVGVAIHYSGMTFYPKTDMNVLLRKNIVDIYEQLSGSFSDHINRMFGWSDTTPSLMFNMFVKNNQIYIVQRGYETNHYSPTNWLFQPTLTHTVRRTEWANSATQTVIPKEVVSSDAVNSNEPFSGTLTWGTTTLTYDDGYLTQEVRGNVTTDYTYTTYDDVKYLTLKEVTDTDAGTFISTTYNYQTTGTERYLYEEETSEYTGSDSSGTLDKKTLTRHIPTNNGWYGTTVYDTTSGTEEFLSDSYGPGAPGQKASQYIIDKSNDALKPSNAQRQMTVPLRGVARARQTYPVADNTSLTAIANCLDTYEGKEEITLTGEIVGGNHIYTYDDTIDYDSNRYYLVSNNVSQNYNTLRQSITAVRWVLS